MLTKKRQDVSENEEEERITQNKDHSHSTLEQNWIVRARREQEFDKQILELKREVSRYKREERRIARNNLMLTAQEEKMLTIQKEKLLTIQKEEMDQKVVPGSPDSQCLEAVHVDQLWEENVGLTHESLEGQIEMRTDQEWRRGEGLVERGMATDEVSSGWVITNLIGDCPVIKDGDLSNASAETSPRGAAESRTKTVTAATQLS